MKYPPNGIPSEVTYERLIIDDKEVQYAHSSGGTSTTDDSISGSDIDTGQGSDDAAAYFPF